MSEQKANKILTQQISVFTGEKEIEYDDTYLTRFLKLNTLELNHELLLPTPILKNISSVYYAGCSLDFMTAILITDCTLMVATDLVDPLFFPSINNAESFSNSFKNKTELFQMADILGAYFEALLGIGNISQDIKPILNIKIQKDILEATFYLRGKHRKIMIYVGRDANQFIPPEFEAESPDAIMGSAFIVDSIIIERLNPKWIIVPPFEENMAIQKSYHITKKFPWTSIRDYKTYIHELYEPELNKYLISKALFIKNNLIKRDFNLWSKKLLRKK